MRFLFITKEYPPIPDSSGRIVYNLVQRLCLKGHIVDVIARDNEAHIQYKGSETVYWIENSKWGKLSKSVKDRSPSLNKKIKYFLASYIRKIVLIFKIGAIGLAVAVLHQVLARSGREEYALLTTMAGVLVVVMMLLPELAELISTLKKIMDF